MIYLDSAATTLEKPATVAQAVAHAINHYASPGRGGYRAGMRAGELLFRCRELAAQLFEVSEPDRVVLTGNATHGLNIAIRSLVEPGMTVLISGYEHNAVTRVLQSIPKIKVIVAASRLFDETDACDKFSEELTKDVDVVICNHVSNVFGFIQPMDHIANLCKERGKPLIVDASQSAGMIPVSMKTWNAAFIAMPGHKGLYGPQGTGILLCGEDAKPLIFGGTGNASIVQEMPDYLPERLEAGTQNVCGAAGLLAGMEFVRKVGVKKIGSHERALCKRVCERLKQIPGVHLFAGEAQSGVVSFVIDGSDCEQAAEQLAKKGIAVRAGLHCAPLAHRTAGTLETGTIRISFSAFSHTSQIEPVIAAIKEIATGGRVL